MTKKAKILIFSFVTILLLQLFFFGYYFFNNSKKDNKIIKEENISLKDDFYDFINAEFLANEEIPSDQSSWGTIEKTQKKIADIENNMVKNMINDKDNHINMYTLYHNILDIENREKNGFEPIKVYIDKIDSTKNIKQLLNVLYELDNELGIGSIFDLELNKDLKDKSKKNLEIVGLEEKCVFFNEPSLNNQLIATTKLYQDIFVEYGYDEIKAQELVDNIANLEKSACEGALSLNELSDIEKIYNLYSLNDVKKIFSNIDINKYLKDYHLNEIDSFIIPSEVTAKAYNNLFVDDNLETLKAYAKLKILYYFSDSLTPSLEKLVIDANNQLLGIQEAKSNEEIAIDTVRTIFADILEKEFVDTYKDEMENNIQITKNIINDIKNEYYNNIKNVSWLSEETKKNALKKLDTLKINVGYPEEFDIISNNYEFKSYEDGSNLVENMINLYQIKHKNKITKFFANDDKKTWDFYVDEVNAYYNSTDNSINVLLGFLMIFDDKSNYYELLGSLGSVVGHEITHAFDFTGSKFDENGNYLNWWSDEDINNFNQKKQEVINYYNLFKFNGNGLNTELEAGENMADLGSFETILNMLKNKEVSNDEYKVVFESYAKLCANKYTTQYLINILLNDEHAPSKIRVNAVLSNLDKFYEIYDIKEGNGMYIEPSKRISIWNK